MITTILVTGGAGYIGSHIVRVLRERGYAVVVLDNLSTGHAAAVTDTPLIVGDLRDDALLQTVLAEHAVDAVIHVAGLKAAGASMVHPGQFFSNNVGGTISLLRAIHRAAVRYVVFSSSSAVYGAPHTLPVNESSALQPENPYGESKLMAEHVLKWYDSCHGLRAASLRYFNAAGAALDGHIGEDWHTTANLIPLVFKAALGASPHATVFGTDYPTRDGTAVRDYVHVLDLAEAHVQALEYLQACDRSLTVNLGTGEGYSVQQVIDTAKRVSGIDIPIVYGPRRPGDPAALYADSSKARQILQWQPRFDLLEIVCSAWRWHSSHPDGYGDG